MTIMYAHNENILVWGVHFGKSNIFIWHGSTLAYITVVAYLISTINKFYVNWLGYIKGIVKFLVVEQQL